MKCGYCGAEAYWMASFDFEDYGREGEGVIEEYQCSGCGAEITYSLPIITEKENETVESETV